jgi:hypothetical protein
MGLCCCKSNYDDDVIVYNTTFAEPKNKSCWPKKKQNALLSSYPNLDFGD